MAEQRTGPASPAGPAVDSMVAEAFTARHEGDQAKVERLNAAIDARLGAEREEDDLGLYKNLPERSEVAAALIEPPKSDVATTEGIAEVLASTPQGQELAARWGDDLGTEVGYARHAVEAWGKQNPDVLSLLTTPFENEKGEVLVLGNDPLVIKLAAEFGRALIGRDGSPRGGIGGIDAVPSRKGPTMPTTSSPARSGRDAIQEQIDAKLREAPPGSQAYKSQRFQRELDALYARLHGGEPVVGRDGRNV